jgi:hypothetical protein
MIVVALLGLAVGFLLGWVVAGVRQEMARDEERVRQLDESVIGPAVIPPKPTLSTALAPDELHFERPPTPDAMLWGNVPFYHSSNAVTRVRFNNVSEEIQRVIALQMQHQFDFVNSAYSAKEYKRVRIVAEFTGGFISTYEMDAMDATSDRIDVNLELLFDVHDVNLYLDVPNA